jgi:hypothetical protein
VKVAKAAVQTKLMMAFPDKFIILSGTKQGGLSCHHYGNSIHILKVLVAELTDIP